MIDLRTEDALSLSAAARLVASWRGRCTADSVWRWIARGIRGVKLEALRTPKGWVTTRSALDRFFGVLTAQERGERLESVSAAARDREREAYAKLRAAGVKC